MRDCSVSLIPYRSERFHRIGTVNRLVYRSVLFCSSVYNSVVFLFDRFRYYCGAVLIQRTYHDSRCALVKSTDSPENRLFSLGFQIKCKRIRQRVALMIMSRMAGKKRTFVDSDQIIVLIDYINRYIHRFYSAIRTGNLDFQLVACVKKINRPDMLPVKRNAVLYLLQAFQKSCGDFSFSPEKGYHLFAVKFFRHFINNTSF